MAAAADDLAAELEEFAPFAAEQDASEHLQQQQQPGDGVAAAAATGGEQGIPIAPEVVVKGRHWSGVEPGNPFRLQVDIGAKRFFLNMERTANGVSRSMETDWPWRPEKQNSDSRDHALRNFHSNDSKAAVNGRVLRNRLLGVSPKGKQVGLGTFFAKSPSPRCSQKAAATSPSAIPSSSSTLAPAPAPCVSPLAPSTPSAEQSGNPRKRPLDGAAEETTEAMDVDAHEMQWTQLLQAISSKPEIELPTSGPLRACTGFQLPEELQPFMSNYPFAYHSSNTKWIPPGPDGVVFARECKGRRLVRVAIDDMNISSIAAQCTDCVRLKGNQDLARVLVLANDDTVAFRAGHRDFELTFTQLKQRGGMHKQRESLHRVALYHKVHLLLHAIAHHECCMPSPIMSIACQPLCRTKRSRSWALPFKPTSSSTSSCRRTTSHAFGHSRHACCSAVLQSKSSIGSCRKPSMVT